MDLQKDVLLVVEDQHSEEHPFVDEVVWEKKKTVDVDEIVMEGGTALEGFACEDVVALEEVLNGVVVVV